MNKFAEIVVSSRFLLSFMVVYYYIDSTIKYLRKNQSYDIGIYDGWRNMHNDKLY